MRMLSIDNVTRIYGLRLSIPFPVPGSDIVATRQEPEAISATGGCALRKSGEHLKADTVSD